jgi:hypothetical protein
MRAEMKEELTGLLEEVRSPHSRVLDPASLWTAEELVRSALAILDRPESGNAPELASEINLGYGVLIATIDLLKSHTDVPRVPRHREDPPK